MKKLAAAVLLGLAVVTMTTACDGPRGSASFSRETITVGGDQFDCIFENRGITTGTMDCQPHPAGETSESSENTKGFSRETITVGGDQFDCIFENRGITTGTMSCQPL